MSSNLFKFRKYDLLKSEIGNISDFQYKHFFTHGRWSMHELLLYLLSQTGRAKVSLSSFSVSDLTIQTFVKARKECFITDFEFILNSAIKRNKLSLLLFAQNMQTKISLLHNHTKLILIENENYSIVVNQSANATINPAHECGVIFTSRADFDIYKQEFEYLFSKAIIL